MTARSGKARSYLSYLAEPLPQGEPALSARRDLLAPSVQMPPQIPVLEDVVVYRDRQPTRTVVQPPLELPSTLNCEQIIPAPDLRIEKAVEAADSARLVGETTTIQSSTRRTQDSERALTAAYVRPSSVSRNTVEQPEQSAERTIEFSSKEGSRASELNTNRSATDRRESRPTRESSVLASAEYASEANAFRDESILSKKTSSTSSLVATPNDDPAQLRTAEIESQPSVANVRSIPYESAKNSSAQMPDAMASKASGNLFNNQKTSSDAFVNVSHKNVRSGPRVVIGTVEIRTRVSQPAPIAASPAQRIADRNLDRANLHGGAPPARPDSLVRSLGWNFGLIQG